MKKHAYLIMAHTQFQQVAKLVRLIDNEENDIYLHIALTSSNFSHSKDKYRINTRYSEKIVY